MSVFCLFFVCFLFVFIYFLFCCPRVLCHNTLVYCAVVKQWPIPNITLFDWTISNREKASISKQNQFFVNFCAYSVPSLRANWEKWAKCFTIIWLKSACIICACTHADTRTHLTVYNRFVKRILVSVYIFYT